MAIEVQQRIREIPFNYTSFSDREIILKYFDEPTWQLVENLRSHRRTGRSAKLIFSIIGDICVIERNPYLFEDFLTNRRKFNELFALHRRRLDTIKLNTNENEDAVILYEKTERLNSEFFKSFSKTVELRKLAQQTIGNHTSENNIRFSPFHRVSHATDATDWRVEHPFAVVYPDSVEEIPGIINAVKSIGLCLIARGGGTGLTGGAVPLQKNVVVLNTEKLTGISAVENEQVNQQVIPVITAEAGVVTDRIIEHCENIGFVFATDPTSSWASTIGGNIAENAGGKKCVMWGTAIDNIYSYQIVTHNGAVLQIQRVNHPYRKILPEDVVVFSVSEIKDDQLHFIKNITLLGTEIRKKGLGKDITNKALNGLPGVQKEGGDGIILSARFVLYKPFSFRKTLCIEFFGKSMLPASKAIVAINNMNDTDNSAYLTALEHFDQKYVRAIQYRNKSSRIERPKAVLLIDIESDDEAAMHRLGQAILTILPEYNSEGIFAVDDAEQKKFWNDRKHLGAIAKHTNAFKLNEDVVIPIQALPDFADYIELLNYYYEISCYKAVVLSLQKIVLEIENSEVQEVPMERLQKAKTLLQELELDYGDKFQQLQVEKSVIGAQIDGTVNLFRKLQEEELKLTFQEEQIPAFRSIFRGFDLLLKKIESAVSDGLKRQIIIATHMHAGDGNVHVNIPVHSSDYIMMREADRAASDAMLKAVELGGVVSGEHGIGLTKIKFLDNVLADAYKTYKDTADPDGIFNPRKLDTTFPMYQVYTPSFNLLECEAIILESTDLEKLNNAIASCVRCGKCKAVCNTHYPKSTMLYNPRNKILAVGLITEAILFSAQTLDMRSFIHFTKLREISDNCTVCHKCVIPCPVKIDFGNVSLRMRELLMHRKKSSPKLMTSAALFYLTRKKYLPNKLFRLGLLKVGYKAQQFAARCHKPVSGITAAISPKLAHLLRTPFPNSGSPSVREVFSLKSGDAFYSFENPDVPVKQSVFYFPGCGSERMFPEVSFAVLALLYQQGIRVVIPNEFLCCGYPFMANGKTIKAELKTYENRVLFHRLADSISYMNISAVIISCGTCYDMLETYALESIFEGAKLLDVNEFLVKERLYQKLTNDEADLYYHEPCHNPLKSLGTQKTVKGLYAKKAVEIPDCCGEAGTLALSRPDISNTLRVRKLDTVRHFIPNGGDILTTCPSCISGLCKLGDESKVTGKSLSVYNAEQFLGSAWKQNFIARVKKNGVEKIIL